MLEIGRDSWIPGAHWQASLEETANSRISETLKRRSSQGRHSHVNLWVSHKGKLYLHMGMCTHTALERQRQMEFYKFKASLVYIVSSRPARAT